MQNVLVCGEPIDPNRTYRVAGTFYILQYSGDGMSMFKNCPVISGDYPSDAEVLIEYMTQKLNGVISAEAYGNKDGNGRIKVVDENRFVEVERVEPTHSAPGYIKYVCEIDGTEKYEELPKLEYAFLEGENGEWAGTDDVLKFRINGDETDLQNVLVDGVLLTRGTQYTVRHGSTIIELTPSYLQTLSVGSHTMTVVYTNGSVSTTFSVRRVVVGSGRTVATSDNSRVQMWSIACMIALMSLLVSAYYRIKKA